MVQPGDIDFNREAVSGVYDQELPATPKFEEGNVATLALDLH